MAIVLLALPLNGLAATSSDLSADKIISAIVARDKVLVERRRSFDYDVDITRDQLDDKKAVVSTDKDKMVMRGDVRPSYNTRGSAGDPKAEAKKTAREEPFEFLKIIDHYNYKLEADQWVDGVECYTIAFTPKDDMPYANREEKVLNNVAGHIWASKKDCTVIRNEGELQRPVSVAWIFAALKEMEFHFDATRLPNGDYGPGRLQYRYLVDVPFTDMHERDTRIMSHYRPATADAK
jgi:hypothetical protein